MGFDVDRIYELLPAIYRLRDSEEGGPLKELLSVVAEQVAVLEENLAQLYDDQFIETCAEWVVPYIGDLLGYRSLHEVSPKTRISRAEVANLISYRRRKGTAAIIEQLARDVTGWDALAVEFFSIITATQYLNHIRMENVALPDLRNSSKLKYLNTPFDTVPRNIDVRRIASGRGRYNIPNVGIFLWRLRAFGLTNVPPAKVDERRYLFSPLGNRARLFTQPQTEAEITHLAEPVNVPLPISRYILKQSLDTYYGPDRSFCLYLDDSAISSESIEVCDLSDSAGTWAHLPKNKYGVDPELGRITLPLDAPAAPDLKVSFHYGFSMEMGGGEYERQASFELTEDQVVAVPEDYSDLQTALDALDQKRILEITDSASYSGSLVFNLAAGERFEIRAANGRRPYLQLVPNPELPYKKPALTVTGEDNSELYINGLTIGGGPLRVTGAVSRLVLRHCTLIPGLGFGDGDSPGNPLAPSLITDSDKIIIEIDRCIMGPLRTPGGARISISNSIIDALSGEGPALTGSDGKASGGILRITNSTVIGNIHTAWLELASNSIFLARHKAGDAWAAAVTSDRTQEGCVRFSSLPFNSRVPQRYRCHPRNAEEEARLEPQFASLRYGDARYGQLSRSCALEIRQGADDEAEMGAFHDLYQAQRESNLRARLDEYLRFGMEAGIFYAT